MGLGGERGEKRIVEGELGGGVFLVGVGVCDEAGDGDAGGGVGELGEVGFAGGDDGGGLAVLGLGGDELGVEGGALGGVGETLVESG